MKLTSSDIIQAIGKLPTNRPYNYINSKTTTKISIAEVVRPLGPIKLKRYNPNKGKGQAAASNALISANMIARVANAIRENQPLNIERIVGGSYNTRSALESLLAHTPEFHVCRPGRIESGGSTTKVKPGHKHLLWCPDDPHKEGVISWKKTEVVISEISNFEAVYEALSLPAEIVAAAGPDIEVARQHARIQIALIIIGHQLGYRSWVARNDKGIIYNQQRIAEMSGVVGELEDEVMIAPHRGAIRAALLIDCIWFRNSKFMPAVIEVEHTTGVTSGLTRMRNLQDLLPDFSTRWVIAAPDEDKDKVVTEANKPMFKSLNARFFPYSAVMELYALCQRRNINQASVNEGFLDAFMEPCVSAVA